LIRLEVGANSDKGKLRINNEDAFCVEQDRVFFIVADGMGGHQAGEVASTLAVDEISRLLAPLADGQITLKDLEMVVEEANKIVYQKSIEDPSLYGMGTTVVVSVIREGRLLLAHVGDSRAYMLTQKGLKRLTNDHSLVFQLISQGEISEEEARLHPRANTISRALGINPAVEVETKEIAYSGELLILCTDGLTDMLKDEEIEKVLMEQADDLQEACDILVKEANEAGGRDNITIIAVRPARSHLNV